MLKLVNLSNGRVMAETVREAYTFRKRLRGLMFDKRLPEGTGIHLLPCRSIHTFFMSFPIDVLYLDKDGAIIGIETNLAPGKLGKSFRGTSSVIELPAGTVNETDTQVGQSVAVRNQDRL